MSKDGWWSVWIGKISLVNNSEILLFLLMFILLIYIVTGKSKIFKSNIKFLFYILLFYIFIGIVYNFFVFMHIKSFLYDFKVFLWLLIPYFLLTLLSIYDKNFNKYINLKNIVIILMLGTLFDYFVVSLFGSNEYPSKFGTPSLMSLLPSTILVGYLYNIFKFKNKIKFFILFYIIIELFNMANRLSLGALFYFSQSFIILALLNSTLEKYLKYVVFIVVFVLYQFLYLGILFNPLNIDLLSGKEEGRVTRFIQLENLYTNFNSNMHGTVGKGLGSTWFEFAPVPRTDTYSTGVSMSANIDKSVDNPVKFVYNIAFARMLHKFGILGSLTILVFIAFYHNDNRRRCLRVRSSSLKKKNNTLILIDIVTLNLVFYTLYWGFAKGIMITALLLVLLEYSLRDTSKQNLEIKNKLLYKE